MKRTSIRLRVSLVVAVCLALGAATVAYLFHLSYQNEIGLISSESLRTSVETFATLQKNDVQMMSAAIEAIVQQDEIRSAFAAKDREKLQAATEPLFKSYNQRYGVTHWNYWEPEAPGAGEVKGLKNFHRMQSPQHGEFLERATLAQVVKTKSFVSGLDLGNTGFGLRVLYPFLAAGRLIGYLELGKDATSFLEIMKRQAQNDYGLAIEKRVLDAKKWESSRSALGLRNNWDDLKEVVLVTNTSKDDRLFEYDRALGEVPASGQVLGLVQRGDATFSRSVFPVLDSTGKRMGAIFVLCDVTGIHRGLLANQTRAVAVVLVLMLAICLLITLMLNRLIFERLNGMVLKATRVVGGDYRNQIEVKANDEVGDFETLFEQFRAVFVDTLDQVENQRRKGTGS
jgi:HAMP domain-containing protein